MASVRPAKPEDADAAVDVVRRSIAELCAADHRDDAATLAAWLANKTPENFRSWISNTENFCVVAERNGRVSGVGLLHRSGEIHLFYLEPGALRQGLGLRINAALEAKARDWGLRKLRLDSTALACAFYEALGYRPTGAAKCHFGVLQCKPYEKDLGAQDAT